MKERKETENKGMVSTRMVVALAACDRLGPTLVDLEDYSLFLGKFLLDQLSIPCY